MDADAKIQQFVILAKGSRGRGLCDLISRATAEPGLFAFGELLELPNVQELQNEAAEHFNLLNIFCYGTWSDFAGNNGSLPSLNDAQKLKLKQLTVISLATTTKVIPYAKLMQQLEIPSVRELEDFIIKECFYSNIVNGKLNQSKHSLHVYNSIGRDVAPDKLSNLSQGLSSWLQTSEELLVAIERQIQFATTASELAQKHKEEVEAKQEEMKKNIKAEIDLRGNEAMLLDEASTFSDYMEEDRTSGRPKSRRR